MAKQRIVIVGAGIGGSALAAILRMQRREISVTLLDKNSHPPRHTYGITLERSTFAPLLTSLDASEKSFMTKTLHPVIRGTDEQPTSAQQPSSIRVTRACLEDFLRQDVDVRWDSTVISVDNSRSPIVIKLENGRDVSADVLISADGVHSAVRKSLLPNESHEVLPFVVLNGRLTLALKQGKELAAVAPEEEDAQGVKVAHSHNSRLAYSIYKYGNDKATLDFTFSRPATGNDQLHKPERSNSSAQDIPEEFYTELDQLQPLTEPFARVFDAATARKARMLHWLMRQSLIQRSYLDQMASKGTIFMGDAAHALPIIGGNGANEALIDAMRLASLLGGPSAVVAQQFYDNRYEAWISAGRKSKQSLQAMHASANFRL